MLSLQFLIYKSYSAQPAQPPLCAGLIVFISRGDASVRLFVRGINQ